LILKEKKYFYAHIQDIMKKILLLSLLSLICGLAFQACDGSKTYAEMLEEEKDAINKFIRKNNIKVITAGEFEKKGNTTDTVTNEYVQFSNGVYMQIVYKGDAGADSIKTRNVILVRFVEYDILAEDTTLANYTLPQMLDAFDYTVSGTTGYGQFRQGLLPQWYETTQVPEGWLVPLQFVKSGARVKLIVPSKVGHATAIQSVSPFYYDLRRITVW
jgi:hypothetical protein